MCVPRFQLLFEGGVYSVQELGIVRLLFEGGHYSRPASIRELRNRQMRCLLLSGLEVVGGHRKGGRNRERKCRIPRISPPALCTKANVAKGGAYLRDTMVQVSLNFL